MKEEDNSSFIKAYLSVLYPLGGSMASLQDPSVVPDSLMGPLGFVICDVYNINCQKEKWWHCRRQSDVLPLLFVGCLNRDYSFYCSDDVWEKQGSFSFFPPPPLDL